MKTEPAFPVPSYVNADGETHSPRLQGMSLRAWLAGQALSNPDICDSRSDAMHEDNARWAVQAADAVLAELAKEKS